jgi:phage terminase large subunit
LSEEDGMNLLRIETAKVFRPLLEPARYKATWGGRGSGKSHFMGEALVERCLLERGTLAVCIREIQRTLAQSSKRLIEDKIAALRVGSQFNVYHDKIETPGDGLIIFQGMQDQNAESIKSLEGFDVAWIEEAQTLSPRSLALLKRSRKTPSSLSPVGATTRGFHLCWRRNGSSTASNIPTATPTSGRGNTFGRSRVLTSLPA